MTCNKLITSPCIACLIGVILIVPSRAVGQQKEEKNGLTDDKPLNESLDGPRLFRAYCTSCHGQEAKGGGPAADSLKIKPADLTRLTNRNGGKFPSLRVQKIISGDGVVTSPHGSREMPVWGPVFGQVERDQNLGKVRIHNLAKYLETLQEK